MAIFHRLLAVVAALFLGVAAGQAQTAKIPLDDNFSIYGIDWGRGAETIILFTARKIQGRTFVCGLHQSRGSVPAIAVTKALQGMRVRAGRQTLKTNLGYFTRVASNARGGDLRATCRRSNVRWNDAFARMRLQISSSSRYIEY